MKIFTPNVKLVEELTKYIRPSDIEKAQFKRFNMPAIKKTNLACDEFFRSDELFDRDKDMKELFQSYGIDDIPTYNNSPVRVCNIERLSNINPHYHENNLPYYVDIIGENKRVYIENYGTKSQKYPHIEMYYNNYIKYGNKKLYENRTVDEIVNIRHYAGKYTSDDSLGLEYEALSLLKKGYPLEAVINIMKESVIKSSNGDLYASKGLMKFIAEYPHLKNFVITHDCNKNEVFDQFGAIMFPDLLRTCNGDEKIAYNILWDCRIEMDKETFLTEPCLLNIGMKLFKIDNVWNDKKAQIVEKLSQKNRKYLDYYSRKVMRMISLQKMSVDEILANLSK